MNTPTPKEQATKNLQASLDKLINAVSKNESLLAASNDIPVEKILSLYADQCKLEAAVNWIINVEQKINPSGIVKNANGIVKPFRR